LAKFRDHFLERDLDSISSEEVLSFLTSLNDTCKQLTKHTRCAYLKALFNFIRNNLDTQLQNPYETPMLKKLFRPGKLTQWQIHEKDVIDEIIFRTTKVRNRLMLELMARGGMRVGEVLKLTAVDVDDQKLTIRNPKSGKSSEVVFIPKKLADRLKDYLKDGGVAGNQRIFPITYTAARVLVKKAGALVGVHLRPHDLRRHAATYASRSGVPVEIVSKVILRHANLATTQRYLGKVSDVEAVRWMENLYG
jgi:integrase/recombinase XerD